MFGLPSFKAWRNALLLMIPAYGAATVVFLFAFWLFFLTAEGGHPQAPPMIGGERMTFCILLPWYDIPFLFFLGMGLIALVIGSVWYLSVNFLYSLFLRLLWDKPPLFLKSSQSLKQNLIHLAIAIAATCPIAAIYVIHLLWIANIEVLTEIDYKSIYVPDFILKLSWLWLIAAAYLYHWKYLFSKRKSRSKEK